ncbi:MAG TPA: LLM class F420-dependent oxidoreductase [Acidimicrobiia bacterium]
MTDVRIAVQIQPQHADYAAIRDAVETADELGFDAAYNWDHFYSLSGDPVGKHFECWTMLGAWAECTSSIEIGALVTCNSYRNPQLLADMARTVDHISGGRLVLGIGAGWFEKDYDEYGYEFGTGPSRLRELDAALPLIKDRWSRLNPPPTRRIPILIGGGGEKVTLRITAEHADVWHAFGSIETISHKLGVLDDWCARVGRDPAGIIRSTGIRATDTTEEAQRSDAEARYALGIRELTLGFSGPRYDIESAAHLLAWRDEKNAG